MLLKTFCTLLPFIFHFVSYVRATTNSQRTAVYAVNFPQYHEDELNNEIWGKGFTEWNHIHTAPAINRNNETILKPHRDIGYYDMSTYEVRKKQADIAKHHGIDGFIYYHYWFYHHTEHKVLAKPLLNMLKDGEPNISFAFNWAAATWEKNWMGKEVNRDTSKNKYFHFNKTNPNIIYEQICPYDNMTAIEEHYAFLRPFFHHPNYIKINGMPLFVFFRWSNVWQCMYILPKLKELAKKDGFPGDGLYVIGGDGLMLYHELYDGGNTGKQYSNAPNERFEAQNYFSVVVYDELKMSKLPSICLEKPQEIWKRNFHPHYIGIMTQYDNTPRRTIETGSITRRKVYHLTQLESFEVDLINTMYYERCCFSPDVRSKSGKFITINAWNEWGEGQVLEPSEQEGYSYLRAVRKIKNKMNHIGCDVRAYKHLMKQYEE
eukprot:gene4195-4490_t